MFQQNQEITNEVAWLNNLQHCERSSWRTKRSATLMNCYAISEFHLIYLFTHNRPDVLAVIIKNTVFRSVTPCSGATN